MINLIILVLAMSSLVTAGTIFFVFKVLNDKIDEQILKDRVTYLINDSLGEIIEKKMKQIQSSPPPSERKNTVFKKKHVISEEGKKRQLEGLKKAWAKRRAAKAAALAKAQNGSSAVL